MQQTSECVGLVEGIEGRVELRDSRRQVRRLDARRDKGVPVFPGDAVRMLDARSRVTLRLYQKVATLTGILDWYPIPALQARPDDPVAIALRLYARPGGRRRGAQASPRFLFPAPDSTLPWSCKPWEKTPNDGRPFTVRWVAPDDLPRPEGKLYLILERKSYSGEVSDVGKGVLQDNHAGFWTALDQALEAAERGSRDTIHAAFRLEMTGYPALTTLFQVLTLRGAAKLNQELDRWRDARDLMQWVGPAGVYEARGMFAEARAQYVQALAKFPDSQPLQQAALRLVP